MDKEMTVRLIESISKQWETHHQGLAGATTLPKFIASQLSRCVEIENFMDRCESDRESAEKSYKRKLKEIDEKVLHQREVCPHYVTKYYPDASGNNDSWYSCVTCGKSQHGNFSAK